MHFLVTSILKVTNSLILEVTCFIKSEKICNSWINFTHRKFATTLLLFCRLQASLHTHRLEKCLSDSLTVASEHYDTRCCSVFSRYKEHPLYWKNRSKIRRIAMQTLSLFSNSCLKSPSQKRFSLANFQRKFNTTARTQVSSSTAIVLTTYGTDAYSLRLLPYVPAMFCSRQFLAFLCFMFEELEKLCR